MENYYYKIITNHFGYVHAASYAFISVFAHANRGTGKGGKEGRLLPSPQPDRGPKKLEGFYNYVVNILVLITFDIS